MIFSPCPFTIFVLEGMYVWSMKLTFPGSLGDFDTIEEGGKCCWESTISWINAEYTEQQI